MAFPPDNSPTSQQGGVYRPEPTADTLPLGPAGHLTPPPPPFGSSYPLPSGASLPPIPSAFPPLSPAPQGPLLGSPDPYRLGRPQLPQAARSAPRTWAIALGVVVAFVLVLAVTVGLAVATGHGDLFKNLFVGSGTATATPVPVVVHVTATPTPTALPTATLAPTATALATATPAPTLPPATATPTPPPFQTYAAVSGLWSMNTPENAQITTGEYTVMNTTVPDIRFGFTAVDALTVYELPIPIPANQTQQVFEAILAAAGATNVQIVQQPESVIIGTNTWSETIIRATVQGQDVETSVLYTTHDSGALAISGTASAADYAWYNSNIFTTMEQSFAFVS